MRAFSLNDSTLLVTGGTGSFGKQLVRCLLEDFALNKLIVLSRDEWKQQQMREVFPEKEYPELRYFIGNVRDKQRLHRAFDGVDVVVHAAAVKQVPTAEYNPFEAVKTNVIGAQNVINAAIDRDVQRVIALSSDKAANPLNLYGATKLCSDKLFVAANHYSGEKHPCSFSVVRYGNVVGSRGSVIPYFLKQRENGVLPITDRRMTRFWITLEEAVSFVLKRLEDMRGGELFVPKIPSMKITDLAKAMAPEAELEEVGIRPGEKLHEVMIPRDDARYTVEFDNYYLVQPAFQWWDQERELLDNGGESVPENFEYKSNQNDHWLSVDELRGMVRNHPHLDADIIADS